MTQFDRTFAALSDPTRRGIIDRLARGEATVSELVNLFELTQPTISSHIKVLETAGLVSRGRRAQTRPCRLNPAPMRDMEVWLERTAEAWEANYKRLDAVLDAMDDDPSPTRENPL